MQDKELHQHILRLTSPWAVSSVELDIPAEEIQVSVEHTDAINYFQGKSRIWCLQCCNLLKY
jgi:hypothetical protein